MLRKRLRDQYSNRRFIVGATVVIMLLLGWVMEYHHRQIDFMDYLGLAEFKGESMFAIFVSVSVQQSLRALLNAFILIVSLLPVAVFNSLAALAALAVIPWLASHFIHTLYGTKNLKEAYDFLDRNVFGMQGMQPIIIVKEGHVAVGAGSLHDRVGGRALVIVYNDSAVVVEKGGQLVHVTGPVFGFLKRFERFWEVVDLRHQRWPFTVGAMTKEGIPVACDADITFKIDDRFTDEKGNVRTKAPVTIADSMTVDAAIDAELAKAGIGKPLPYTDTAVFKAATSIWVRIRQPNHSEQLRKWTGRVLMSEVEGALRGILFQYRLDELMRPSGPGRKHPRKEIQEKLERKLRDTLTVQNKIGARVLRVDLGQIDVDRGDEEKKISAQWRDVWQAGWEQRAAESQTEGEVELGRLQAAQAQARAETLLLLADAIRPYAGHQDERSAYTLSTRFVDTLWQISSSPEIRDLIPPETMQTLDELETMLDRGEEKQLAQNELPQE